VKFKLDENLPASSARLLAKSGHDVDTVAAEGLTGAADPDVVAAAAAEERVLITLDRGLGDLRAYPPGSHAGIVVLRLTDQSAPAVDEAITELATCPASRPSRGPWQYSSAECCGSATPEQLGRSWPGAVGRAL
jgi:predicted nuclease of predicted toxin-antitoxin system